MSMPCRVVLTRKKHELRRLILSMLNSSFFLKQLGYVETLKAWLTFVAEPNDRILFPRFIKPELGEKILNLAMFEAKEALKDIKQDLENIKTVIEKEIAPRLKQGVDTFMTKSSEAFSLMRKFLIRDQANLHELIEGAKKVHQVMLQELEESSFSPKLKQQLDTDIFRERTTDRFKGSIL